ncbi:MAG: RNA 2',3'-cyclic phosphodiesterase [Gammaproteobacteria bacterium]|jgi:2'-5' RNA ligase
MADSEQRKRLFLALWPDDITRTQLAAVQKQFSKNERLQKAKPVPVENLHITMHFLGAVTEEVHFTLQTLLDSVKVRACNLVIDRWGYFPRPKVLWLGAKSSPEPLTELVLRTESCIKQCIEGYEQNRFVPHITVFRKARHPVEADEFQPIDWRIDRFALVASDTRPEGAVYTVLKEWMLS